MVRKCFLKASERSFFALSLQSHYFVPSYISHKLSRFTNLLVMLKNMLSAAKDVSSSALEQSKKAVDVTKQKLADFDENNTCRSCGKTLSTTLAV